MVDRTSMLGLPTCALPDIQHGAGMFGRLNAGYLTRIRCPYEVLTFVLAIRISTHEQGCGV